jgi:uncharacterized protein YrrD
MRKGSDIIGKPVVAYDTGERFERILDLVFDPSAGRLLGFVVSESGLFGPARVLPLPEVHAIGPDAVIVPAKGVIVRADQLPEIKHILDRNNALKGKQLITTEGRHLGTLADLYFDERSGAIEGYEISGGPFASADTGRSFVPAPHAQTIGRDVVFVPPETAGLMEEQVGGVEGAVLGTSLGAQEAAAAGEQPRDTNRTTQQFFVDSLTDQTAEQARGRRARQMIRTDSGVVVAAPGQIVTAAVLDRARMYGKERELLDATGLSAGATARAATDGARETASARASMRAVGAWERFRRQLGAFQDRTERESQAKAIKEALGRPVTRVVLDRQDSVILNVGDLITHHAVERARAEGVLDILLSSVYRKAPDLTWQDVALPRAGGESLEADLRERERGT